MSPALIFEINFIRRSIYPSAKVLYSINMNAGSNALAALAGNFPYEVHQVMGPDNQLVWVERGVNPDDVFKDKRKTDWPFSEVIADLICQQVVEGASLTSVCKQQIGRAHV